MNETDPAPAEPSQPPGAPARVSVVPPESRPEPRPEAHKPREGRSPLVVLTALGFALAAVVLAFLWQEIIDLSRREMADPVRVANLETQMRNLQQRVDVLERRPVAQPAAPAPDLKPLEDRIAALEQAPPPAAATPPVPAPMPDLGPIQARIGAAEAAARRALALQAAAAALAAGKPLGDIPGAPPALARFATAAPPTLVSLRRDFAAAAAKAEAASTPAEPRGFAQGIWQRMEGLVTIRRGAEVLVGTPAAVTLGMARRRLEGGDIAGAIAALNDLDPGAAEAMAAWRGEAQALLDARAALASD